MGRDETQHSAEVARRLDSEIRSLRVLLAEADAEVARLRGAIAAIIETDESGRDPGEAPKVTSSH